MIQNSTPTLAGIGPLGTPEIIILLFLLGMMIGLGVLVFFIVKNWAKSRTAGQVCALPGKGW